MTQPKQYPGLVAVPRSYHSGEVVGAYTYKRLDELTPEERAKYMPTPALKIHNIRYGHATNSSSSHSVIVLGRGLRSDDDSLPKGSSVHDGGYGWEHFLLKTVEQKDRYLLVQLWAGLRRNEIPEDFAKAIILDFLGVDVDALKEDENDPFDVTDGYVDHQSQWDFNPEMLTKDFVQDLRRFLHRDDVVVRGGNDNDDEYLSVPGKSFNPLDSRREVGRDKTRLLKDGDYWVFYNAENGFKTRFSFGADTPEYTKASRPELVDLKITNFCPYAATSPCGEFCYEGSNAKGKHADINYIRQLGSMFNSLGVLEVSMGGGALEYHPGIVDIINTLRYSNLTVNITILNTKGLVKNEKLVKTIKDSVSGVGVSCHDLESVANVVEVQDLLLGPDATKWKWQSENPGKCWINVMAHVVVGSAPLAEMLNVVRALAEKKIPILLLGYKNVGEGASFKPWPIDSIALAQGIKKICEKHYLTLSVDTLFLEQHGRTITALKVPTVLTTSPEGKFSCYVDAVEQTVSPSSYIPRDQMEPMPDVKLHRNQWGGMGDEEAASWGLEFKKVFAKY
jgi:hypothetical protein